MMKKERDLLASAAVMALGTSAYADIEAFENDGSFSWPLHTLDITKAANNQETLPGMPTALTQAYESYDSDYFSRDLWYTERGGAEIWETSGFATPLGAGTEISGSVTPSGAWDTGTLFYLWTFYCSQFFCDDEADVTWAWDPGQTTYLGVRFSADDGMHYGWIKALMDGNKAEALAWAYETEPGVPIAAGAVPAPGTLGALAIGAAARGRKRR